MEVEGERLTFCIEEKLEGQILGDIKNDLSPQKLEKIIQNAGLLLSRIHSIPTKGFGQLNEKGEGEFKTWMEFMLEQEGKEKRWQEVSSKTGIDLRAIEMALETIRSHKTLYSDVLPK